MLNHFTKCPLCNSEITEHHWRKFCSNRECGQVNYDASSDDPCNIVEHKGQHYDPFERVRVGKYYIEFYEDSIWIHDNDHMIGSILKFSDIDTEEKIAQVIMNYQIMK